MDLTFLHLQQWKPLRLIRLSDELTNLFFPSVLDIFKGLSVPGRGKDLIKLGLELFAFTERPNKMGGPRG